MAAEQVNEPIPIRPAGSEAYHGAAEMTLLEHLKELRNRVVVCAAAVVLGTIVSFLFWETILGWLLAPARQEIPEFKLVAFSPTESIGLAIKIGLYGGLTIASPVILYEILAFIVPGLTPREKKVIFPGMIAVVGFLLGGMAFAYWVILPRSLGFLLNFGNDQVQIIPHAAAYLGFAIRIIFWVGISFELPVVLGLAARLHLVRAKQLLQFWRYAVVIIFVIAAVITPTPDPYNQSLVAGPLFFLYFVGVFFAWILQPKRKSVAEAA
ncbi:MAG: twin-arginine translocase subunit TatC [bacterium]